MLKELRKPEVVQEIIYMKLAGSTMDDIRKTLLEKFGIDIAIQTITNVYENEIRKIGNAEFASKDLIIDKDDTIKKLVDSKVAKIDIVITQLEEVINTVNVYRKTVNEWVNLLEADMKQYYDSKKEKQDVLSIGQINNIKDSILRSVGLLTSGMAELTKFIEMHARFMEIAKPSEVKIDRMDMSFRINQEITNIEKMGYLMIKPETPEFTELLKESEKKGDVRVFKRL